MSTSDKCNILIVTGWSDALLFRFNVLGMLKQAKCVLVISLSTLRISRQIILKYEAHELLRTWRYVRHVGECKKDAKMYKDVLNRIEQK